MIQKSTEVKYITKTNEYKINILFTKFYDFYQHISAQQFKQFSAP